MANCQDCNSCDCHNGQAKKDAKALIAATVAGLQGLKATELAAIPEIGALPFELVDLLDECIKEGLILEVEYQVPNLPGRVKSFLLPKGSKVYA